MTSAKFTRPEEFSLSPLLSLLPVKGDAGRLENFTSSLYARYEKVSRLLKELSAEQNQEMYRGLHAEQLMLRQVLDWLNVSPE